MADTRRFSNRGMMMIITLITILTIIIINFGFIARALFLVLFSIVLFYVVKENMHQTSD